MVYGLPPVERLFGSVILLLSGVASLALFAVEPRLPVINRPPANGFGFVGASISLVVEAGGPGPLGYQWTFNGRTLAGATNAVLTLTDLQSNQAGLYAVLVTNPYGAITSSPTTLQVSEQLREQWRIRPAGLGGAALNARGELFVSGDSGTTKFDAAGRLLWRSGRPGGAVVAADGAGGAWTLDYAFAQRLDSRGNWMWGCGDIRGFLMAPARDGSLYIYGAAETYKVDAEGHLHWRKPYVAVALAVGSDDHVVLLCGVKHSNGEEAFALRKIDPDGSELWEAELERTIPSSGALCLDLDGNIYLAASGSSRPTDTFVAAKFSPAGVCQWRTAYHELLVDRWLADRAGGGDRGGDRFGRSFLVAGYLEPRPGLLVASAYDGHQYSPEDASAGLSIRLPAFFRLVWPSITPEERLAGWRLSAFKYARTEPNCGNWRTRVSPWLWTHATGSTLLGAAWRRALSSRICRERHGCSLRLLAKPIFAGSDVVFEASAAGAGSLAYQWLHNGWEIAGAVGTRLVLTNVDTWDGGQYQMQVRNAGATIVGSSPAHLHLSATTGAPNLLEATERCCCRFKRLYRDGIANRSFDEHDRGSQSRP
ncbi:MAG: immunoglobulin domain-containing protein [Verrucomicrobiota bacterium]